MPPSTLWMSWLRTSPAPSWLPLCLSSLGGQGTGSTFCSVCSVLGGEAPLLMRFLSSKFLHPVCSIRSWRGQIKTLSMWFRAGGTHEVFQSWRAQGRWLGWAQGGDGERPPGVEADGVGGMSSATRESPGENRWCVGRLLVAPREGRQRQGGCWVAPWGSLR